MVLDRGTSLGWGSLPDLRVLEVGSLGPGPAVSSEPGPAVVTDGEGDEVENGKTGSLVTVSEVGMALSPTAITAAVVGEDEVAGLEVQWVEDGSAVAEVAMTLSSS